MINSTDLSRFCMGSSLLQITSQLKFFAIINLNADHNQTGLQMLNCLILLHTYRNEFVKIPKMRIFENITFDLKRKNGGFYTCRSYWCLAS